MKLQEEIYGMVKAGNYKEALSWFKSNKGEYTLAQIASNPYLTSDMLRAMRMTQSWEAAEKYLQIYKIPINEETPERVLTAWMLTLYDHYKSLAEKETPPQKTVVRITSALPLLELMESNFSNSLYNNIVAKILKTESKRTQPDWQMMKDLCESVNREKLNPEPHKIVMKQKGIEKEGELASQLEEWYVQYSKSLLTTADYEKCIAISDEALKRIKPMHYSNDIWLSRRIAQCHAKLGRIEIAIEWFEKILKRKSDWFLMYETAQLHKMKGNLDKARHLMLQAMTKAGDIGYKVELIETLGDVYAETGDEPMAKKHWQLASSIRASEGWKIDRQLAEKAEFDFENNSNAASINKLIKELSLIWSGGVPASKTKEKRLEGKITKMSKPKETGIDVWIKTTDNKMFYAFVRSDDAIFTHLKVGTKVSFHVKPIADRPLDRAVGIKELK